MKYLLALLLLLIYNPNQAFAQFESSITEARWRKVAETEWAALPAIEWAANPPVVEIGVFQIQRPSKLRVRVDVRFALEFENRRSTPIQSYVTGSVIALGFGENNGIYQCSNVCGGGLAASDGINYVCQVAHPDSCIDVGLGLDHHVLVGNFTSWRDVGYATNGIFDWGVSPAGTHTLTAQVYTATQEFDGVAQSHASHEWDSGFVYFEVRETIYAQ